MFLQKSIRHINGSPGASRLDLKYKDEILKVLKKQLANPMMKKDEFRELRSKIREILEEQS